MPTVTNGGVAIHYEVDGPADAEPVAFVEGLGYGRWMWRWQREALQDGYRVVTWDNRGTGDSDAPEGPYTMTEMAADLEAVLDAVDVDRAHVVGASMGGMIAQEYALAYDRAATLTLIASTHGGPEALPVPEETRAAMFAVPEGADERETIRHRMRPAVTDDFYDEHPDLVEDIVDWRLAGDASEEGRNAQAAAVEAFDVSDRVDEIDEPVLLVHGEDDRVVPVENSHLLHEKLQDSRLELVPGGPHLVFIEEAEVVNDRILAFLDANPIEEVR